MSVQKKYYINIYVLIILIVIGLTIGIGAYTFIYAEGGSYLTDKPSACANCHIMNDYYESWLKSSHHAVAVCNDCHTPDGFFPKYITKASNGFWHSWGFTTGIFPDPIQIKEQNKEVTRESCRKCHFDIVENIERESLETENVPCAGCHKDVGHR